MICNCACRFVLLIINTVTLLVGIALLIVGAIMVWGQSAIRGVLSGLVAPILKLLNLDDNSAQMTELISKVLTSTTTLGMVVFVLGAVFAILSAIGYFGACCNYKIVLTAYAILVAVVDGIILIVIIMYYASPSTFTKAAVQLYKESVENYVSLRHGSTDSLAVAVVQNKLKCCGLDSPDDFKSMESDDVYQGQTYQNLKHPIPCCKEDDQFQISGSGCPGNFTTENSYIGTGCRQRLSDTLLHYLRYVVWGLIVAFLVLLVLIGFTYATIKIDLI